MNENFSILLNDYSQPNKAQFAKNGKTLDEDYEKRKQKNNWFEATLEKEKNLSFIR